jgi:DDE superfamily endonuclease
MKNHQPTYTVVQKLATLDLVKKIGMKPASRESRIPLCSIKRWRRNEVALRETVNTKGIDPTIRQRKLYNTHRAFISKEVEDELLHYVEKERDDNWKITIAMAMRKVKLLDSSLKNLSRVIIRKRLWRIFHRRNIVIRRITHKAQGILYDGFTNYVKEKMKLLDIGFENICNFDETNIPFSMDGNITLNRKGERTISVNKSPSVERASLMIGVSGSGYKFPPFLIFKGINTENGRINRTFKRMERLQDEEALFYPDSIIHPINNKPTGTLENYPLAASCTVQKNAYMDTDTMLLWLERVYRPWAVTINGPNIIILDTSQHTKLMLSWIIFPNTKDI